MKVAETSSSRDSEPAETRGSWVKWTRHLARKSRVSSNENGPRRLIKFAGHVHNRTAPADGGRLREIVPIEIQGAHTSRPLFRPRRTRPFRRSPGGLPSVLRSFQISRENLVNATSVRDLPRIHDCAPHTRAFGHLRGHRTCRDTPQTTNVSPNPRNTIRVALDSPPRLRFSRRINNGKLNFQT